VALFYIESHKKVCNNYLADYLQIELSLVRRMISSLIEQTVLVEEDGNVSISQPGKIDPTKARLLSSD
jgi:hypothetical protein